MPHLHLRGPIPGVESRNPVLCAWRVEQVGRVQQLGGQPARASRVDAVAGRLTE